jgi:hypothetical protein
MINMMFSVFGDDAALKIVRLYSGEMFEATRFGYKVKLNKKTKAAIVKAEEIKA